MCVCVCVCVRVCVFKEDCFIMTEYHQLDLASHHPGHQQKSRVTGKHPYRKTSAVYVRVSSSQILSCLINVKEFWTLLLSDDTI